MYKNEKDEFDKDNIDDSICEDVVEKWTCGSTEYSKWATRNRRG